MKEKLDIEQRQQQQQTQRLSPRQVLFMRVLEMPAQELEEAVNRKIDENLALEIADPIDDAINDPTDEGSSVTENEREDRNGSGEEHEEHYGDTDDPDDSEYPGDTAYQGNGMTNEAPIQSAPDEDDMIKQLTDQVSQLDLDPETIRIALYIIYTLDDSGYMTRTRNQMREDILISFGEEVPEATMRAAFDAVRSLEPAGIGAVDLRDCLLLQLARKPKATPHLAMATEILKDYYDLWEKKHYDQLQAKLGIKDRDHLREALGLISKLNPKPGAALGMGATQMRSNHIIPDVEVQESADGRFTVSLVSNLPQLQISHSFTLDAQMPGASEKELKEAQPFIRLQREEAEAFISALRSRGETLLRVTEAIVKRQSEFFATGDKSLLKPMVLRDIESDTGIELSTVSRATAGKYVDTPNGLVSLKELFNEAANGEADISSHKLMHCIKEIVDAEDKSHPLSDDAIMEALKGMGYTVARRTITKYRKKLGIPVGRLRKIL